VTPVKKTSVSNPIINIRSDSRITRRINFSYVPNYYFMSKKRVECGVCGSIYELTSKAVQRLDTGTIYCSVCNNNIFEYSEYQTWYPFLVTRKENHKSRDSDPTSWSRSRLLIYLPHIHLPLFSARLPKVWLASP